MSYNAQHTSSLATMQRKGIAMTWTGPRTGTLDAATDRKTSGSSAAVAGYGARVRGREKEYDGLSMVQSEAPTFFFIPTTYGAEPALNSTAIFGGVTYTLARTIPIDPDGRGVIGFRCIASK